MEEQNTKKLHESRGEENDSNSYNSVPILPADDFSNKYLPNVEGEPYGQITIDRVLGWARYNHGCTFIDILFE